MFEELTFLPVAQANMRPLTVICSLCLFCSFRCDSYNGNTVALFYVWDPCCAGISAGRKLSQAALGPGCAPGGAGFPWGGGWNPDVPAPLPHQLSNRLNLYAVRTFMIWLAAGRHIFDPLGPGRRWPWHKEFPHLPPGHCSVWAPFSTGG